ncbi:MAG: hypothetical protein ACRC80_31105 [Waterburya sp.]
MSVNWEKLEISQAELDELVNFDLLSTWAIDISRVFLLSQKTYYKSLLMTEAVYLFLILFLLFPINLIIFRNFNWLSNNISGLILVLIVTSFLAFLILLMLNYYLWGQAKRLKVFAILLEKVKQYNNLIDNLKLAAQLNSLGYDIPNTNNEQTKTELKTALNLTKNSLLKSIELEKILNRFQAVNLETKHQNTNNRYQLLANLESGLINLESLTQYDTDNYQQLLSEAIAIGLSVHQEIRKTQTLQN